MKRDFDFNVSGGGWGAVLRDRMVIALAVAVGAVAGFFLAWFRR